MSTVVFPAYAGMSRSRSRRCRPVSCFPRLRGDEPDRPPPGARPPEFSPPTRG